MGARLDLERLRKLTGDRVPVGIKRRPSILRAGLCRERIILIFRAFTRQRAKRAAVRTTLLDRGAAQPRPQLPCKSRLRV